MRQNICYILRERKRGGLSYILVRRWDCFVDKKRSQLYHGDRTVILWKGGFSYATEGAGAQIYCGERVSMLNMCNPVIQ